MGWAIEPMKIRLKMFLEPAFDPVKYGFGLHASERRNCALRFQPATMQDQTDASGVGRIL